MLREALSATKRGGGWFRVAQLSALTGQRQKAKQALERACAAREPATISAPSDLWLSRALNVIEIAERCGRTPLAG